MPKLTTVTKSPIHFENDLDCWVLSETNLVEEKFTAFKEAYVKGLQLRQYGYQVIVKNSFSEEDESTGEEFFREWRSYNKGPLVEARFFSRQDKGGRVSFFV